MKNFLFGAALILVSGLASPSLAQEDFRLTSPDIGEGQQLSNKHVLNGFGCEGENLSPELSWTGAPEGTKSFVVTAYDPDAPTGSGFWHWIVFDIPGDATGLPGGAGPVDPLPSGAVQSRTDFGLPGFGGACPPPGEVLRYEFRVHALGVETLGLDENSSGALVGFMTYANSLAIAKLTAVYVR